ITPGSKYNIVGLSLRRLAERGQAELIGGYTHRCVGAYRPRKDGALLDPATTTPSIWPRSRRGCSRPGNVTLAAPAAPDLRDNWGRCPEGRPPPRSGERGQPGRRRQRPTPGPPALPGGRRLAQETSVHSASRSARRTRKLRSLGLVDALAAAPAREG